MTMTINYQQEAEICDKLREASTVFAKAWRIDPLVAYNAFLHGAAIQRQFKITFEENNN